MGRSYSGVESYTGQKNVLVFPLVALSVHHFSAMFIIILILPNESIAMLFCCLCGSMYFASSSRMCSFFASSNTDTQIDAHQFVKYCLSPTLQNRGADNKLSQWKKDQFTSIKLLLQETNTHTHRERHNMVEQLLGLLLDPLDELHCEREALRFLSKEQNICIFFCCYSIFIIENIRDRCVYIYIYELN